MMSSPAVHPMIPMPFSVRTKRRERHDTVSLTLDARDRPGGFAFAPGQFNMLYVFGVGEVPISMSGDPARSHDLVHTVKSVGAVTEALCRMRKGDVIGVRGPFGTPFPLEEARGCDIILIAGGLGLAPLRPLLYTILRERASFDRVVLLAGARDPAEILFQREMQRLSARKDLHVRVSVDTATAGWSGPVGLVTTLMAGAPFDPARSVALACGPEAMMHSTADELIRLGMEDDRIFLVLERNMKCAIGLCGRCQYGPHFACKDGPALRLDRIRALLSVPEL